MSPKRFDGWEPRQFTEGFDEQGQPCRLVDAWTTVTTVETEWDDTTRGRVEALAHHDAESCPGCGIHPSAARPGADFFTPKIRSCPVCAARDGLMRRLADQDEKFTKAHPNLPPSMPRPDDGRHVHFERVSPVEAETLRRRRTEHGDG